MTATTMTATNHDDQRRNLEKCVQRCREFDDFLKAHSQFFTFSLPWPSWYHGIGSKKLVTYVKVTTSHSENEK